MNLDKDIDDAVWDPEDWEAFWDNEIIKPAEQRLADHIDDMIAHKLIHGTFP